MPRADAVLEAFPFLGWVSIGCEGGGPLWVSIG